MRTKELEFDGKTYICRIVDSIIVDWFNRTA